MAREFLELSTDDESTILVAVSVPEAAVQRTATLSGEPLDRMDKKFGEVKDFIIRSCKPLTEAFQELHQSTNAKNAEVEFGISFTIKGSVYLVESSGGANLKVKVTWDFEPKQ